MKNNRNHNIHILSAPVRSGKTSRLQEWLAMGISACGILTPDKHGQRMIYDIAGRRHHIFEVNETYGGEKVSIGKFLFSKNAFQLGREILAKAAEHPEEWLIIDEVGKLEIEQGEGFEPMVLRLVEAYREMPQKGKLLLVIRDSLLEKALYKYNLEGCIMAGPGFPL